MKKLIFALMVLASLGLSAALTDPKPGDPPTTTETENDCVNPGWGCDDPPPL